MRTHYCAELSIALAGQRVTLAGWAHRRRDHGGVIFIDLRDREGLAQVVCDPDRAEAFQAADRVRSEFVLRVTGRVLDQQNAVAGQVTSVNGMAYVLGPGLGLWIYGYGLALPLLLTALLMAGLAAWTALRVGPSAPAA